MTSNQSPTRTFPCDDTSKCVEIQRPATIRRLLDADVRAIFESLHHGAPPPSHLNFQIVPVGPTGLRLSPPAIEFEDGLYVLLRPAKKRKYGANEHPKAPSHLRHLLMKETLPEICPWSLSGPQFPQPTAIQQRYCYPKGRPEFSKQKGGALWTMYGTDGKEDVEYRLLHVYYSAKRAINKGLCDFEDESSKSTISPDRARPYKCQKVARLPSSVSINAIECTPPLSHGGSRHHFVHPVAPSPYYPSPRTTAASTIGCTMSCEVLTPHSPVLPFSGSNFVTPTGFSYSQDRWTHNPRSFVEPPMESLNIDHGPLRGSLPNDDYKNDDGTLLHDNYSVDLSASWQDIECYWDDSMMNIVTHHSNDSSASGNGVELSDSESYKSDFSHRLTLLKQALHDNIIAASIDDREDLLQMLDDWGQTIADYGQVELSFPAELSDLADDSDIQAFLIDDESLSIEPLHSEAI